MWKEDIKLITKNKKAYFDYEIVKTYEAWIKLVGHEVKSVRQWHVNLKGSYVSMLSWEPYVKWMHVTPWKSLPNRTAIEPENERKLFLHKRDILFLSNKLKEKWLSIVPLEIYFRGSLIKLSIGLAKWKKLHEKKQVLKERSMDKEAKIAMKKYI